MDFEKYNFRLNIKACCLYEQISGKNFFMMSTDEDLLEFLYACLVANNENLMMTYKVFLTLVSDEKVFKWIDKSYKKIMEFNTQFVNKKEEKPEEKKDEEEEPITMTDVAAALIVRHHIDAHYVMYEMGLWEIQPYLTAADIQRKADLVTQRFWTYLTLSPNINTKKVKSPEELVPFEWEKDDNKAQKNLEKHSKTAMAFLLGKKKEEENGGEL